MKVEIEISDEFLKDQIQSADVSYWAKDGYCHLSSDDWISVQEDCVMKGDEPDHRFPLDWKRAIQCAVKDHPWILDPSKMDKWTGDIWIQLAAFGEVRYG